MGRRISVRKTKEDNDTPRRASAIVVLNGGGAYGSGSIARTGDVVLSDKEDGVEIILGAIAVAAAMAKTARWRDFR